MTARDQSSLSFPRRDKPAPPYGGSGRRAAAALAPIATLGLSPAHAAQTAPAFLHGIASGDPLPDGVLLWTRVTPSPEAVPGSGLGPATAVGWEVAEDRNFTRVVAGGAVTATAAADHTVKVDVRGLRPHTPYWYRFTAGRPSPRSGAP